MRTVLGEERAPRVHAARAAWLAVLQEEEGALGGQLSWALGFQAAGKTEFGVCMNKVPQCCT